CIPFTADDAVDLDAQSRVVRLALDAGAHGLVLFGLAGEFLKLTANERKQLIDAVQEEVDGRVPVFIGVGAESVSAACDLAGYAERAGAACVVVPAPISGAAAGGGLVGF